jgi:hypothetical protein
MDDVNSIGIVLNLTVVNEVELLIQFEAIVKAKVTKTDAKYCVVQQSTF